MSNFLPCETPFYSFNPDLFFNLSHHPKAMWVGGMCPIYWHVAQERLWGFWSVSVLLGFLNTLLLSGLMFSSFWVWTPLSWDWAIWVYIPTLDIGPTDMNLLFKKNKIYDSREFIAIITGCITRLNIYNFYINFEFYDFVN